MKNLSYFKILINYLKEDKSQLFLYILITIINCFEPLLNTYIWAMVFSSLASGISSIFYKYLILWSGLTIVSWVILQIPIELIYNKLEKKFMEHITKDLYTKVSNLPAVAFEDIGVGEFINRMANDPDRILELLKRLIRLSCRLFIAIIIVIITFTISFVVGLELILLCVVMFILSNIYYPKIKKTHEAIKKESDIYIKEATQNISGIREIKALGIKNNINRRMYINLEKLFANQRKIGVDETLYYSLNNLCYFIIEFIILLTLGHYYFTGIISLASVIVIDKYIWRIDEVVESLSEFGISYNKVIVSLKRIDEILNNRLYQDEKFGTKELKNEDLQIMFKNVKFKYRKEDTSYILKGLNLKLEPHKKIAVVGKSGQGKSTIFNLLLRYFDTNIGNISINNTNIKSLSEQSLRDNISVIRQSPFLFNSTIFDNFKVVKEDVTLEEIRKVCQKAYIDDYIMSLPNQYNTIIGEGGINLSGGQKQRMAIARTLLKNTKIILFDEATSALDNESQEYIKKTIDNLVATHTIIIVAHRLSTIMDADIIHVIDNGQVIASGTHKELMKKSPLYQKLYSPELIDVE